MQNDFLKNVNKLVKPDNSSPKFELSFRNYTIFVSCYDGSVKVYL